MSVGASGASSAPVAHVFGSGSTSPTPEETKALKELIAAKLVGRWQDGSSLVRNPQFPASKSNPDARPDNAFMLGAEDPRGLSCPFGSHIRRANPRDTRFHGTQEESRLEVEGVNRHRILRVGRAYTYTEEVDDSKVEHTGLLFMCLNADIERQFEFIQKTWLLNRNIHGLEDEGDPIMSCGAAQLHDPHGERAAAHSDRARLRERPRRRLFLHARTRRAALSDAGNGAQEPRPVRRQAVDRPRRTIAVGFFGAIRHQCAAASLNVSSPMSHCMR